MFYDNSLTNKSEQPQVELDEPWGSNNHHRNSLNPNRDFKDLEVVIKESPE